MRRPIQIATSSHVRLVDVDQAFQQSGGCAQLTVRRDGSNDYLHPNDAGNTLVAQTVAAVVNLVIGIDHSTPRQSLVYTYVHH